MGEWRKVKLGNLLYLYRIEHIIQNDKNYRQVTISKNSSISFRGSKIGKNIGRKRQFIIDLIKYPNTVLFTRQGIRDGAIGIAPSEVDGCIVTENMPMMSVNTDLIEVEYLRKLLLSDYLFNKIRLLSVTGSAQKTIHEKDLLKIEIELPPIEEQRDKCIKFNSLDIEYLYLKTELTHQQTLVKKLRQQILQEAIEGKLTADWRENNPDAEPASELLVRIQAEKAQLIKDKKIKAQKPLAPIGENEKPFDLPKGWVWCRLGEIASITRGKNPKYSQPGIFKMINQKCVRWYYVDTKHAKAIDNDWFESIDSITKIQNNDVLVNSTGDGTIGRSAIASSECMGYMFDSHILKVKSYQKIIQKIICFIINSNFGQEFIENIKGATSTKQTELGVNNLSNFILPLPPLPEQKAIVTKVEKLLALCDQLESQIIANQAHAEQLMQAVLKEAFNAKTDHAKR